MLYSGVLGKEVVTSIVASAAAHGDSTLGIMGNRSHVVAFTAIGTAYGLLQHDLIREFLILYYSHAFHLHTHGDLDRVRVRRSRQGPGGTPALLRPGTAHGANAH